MYNNVQWLHLIDQLITSISFIYTHPCDYIIIGGYNYFKCQINGGAIDPRIDPLPSRFQKSKLRLRKFTGKGIQRIIPYVEHVDRSHQQRVDVYLFPGAAILSESKKEREREKIGEKKQNKNTRDG